MLDKFKNIYILKYIFKFKNKNEKSLKARNERVFGEQELKLYLWEGVQRSSRIGSIQMQRPHHWQGLH